MLHFQLVVAVAISTVIADSVILPVEPVSLVLGLLVVLSIVMAIGSAGVGRLPLRRFSVRLPLLVLRYGCWGVFSVAPAAKPELDGLYSPHSGHSEMSPFCAWSQ